MKLLYIYFVIVLFNSLNLAEEWHVKENADNSVKFISSTSLLDFEGITNKIDGYLYWDGKELAVDNNELYFEVELNSVKTGIGKRDKDMRNDVLETNKWPKTYFKGRIKNIEQMYDSLKIIVLGKMFLHGIEKDLEVSGKLINTKDMINVLCDFSVFLNDYNIEAPSLLAFIKVSEEIKLKLNFFLVKYED